MEIKKYKNKFVVAELRSDCKYILLVNATKVSDDHWENSGMREYCHKNGIQVMGVADLDNSIKFVEVKIK